jgi:hypothetical protein
VPMPRRLPAVGLHVLVALVDLAFGIGEGALRIASLIPAMLLGDKALTAAVEGILRFLFLGNLWWIVLHAAAAGLLMVGRSRWRWGFGAVLVAGRLGFVLANGRPWFDIGGANWPSGLAVFYTVVFLVLGAAQALAWPRRAPLA